MECIMRDNKNKGKVHGYEIIVRSSKEPKAIDKDLYKIHPELLYQKHWKKKILGRDGWSRCLGLGP